MTISAFINDGYTETRTFSEVRNLHPEFSIVFRPMTVDEVSEWSDATSGKSQKASREETIKIMIGHIKSWTFEANPSVELMKTAKTAVYNKMFDAIWAVSALEDDAKN